MTTPDQAPTAPDLVDPVTHAANVQERERNTERLLAGLRDSNKALTAEVHRLRADRNAHDAQVADLSKALLAKDERIAELESARHDVLDEVAMERDMYKADAAMYDAWRIKSDEASLQAANALSLKQNDLTMCEAKLAEVMAERERERDATERRVAHHIDVWIQRHATAESRASSAEAERDALREKVRTLEAAIRDHAEHRNSDTADRWGREADVAERTLFGIDRDLMLTLRGQAIAYRKVEAYYRPTPAEPDCKGSGKRDEYQVAESAEQCADELEAALGTSKEGR